MIFNIRNGLQFQEEYYLKGIPKEYHCGRQDAFFELFENLTSFVEPFTYVILV